ncbi:MAG: rane protein yebN [Firmicutes bacterium]|nr:rane protein yebN [Bacillota bacterium]
MSLLEIVVLSAALGTDLFSVAIPIGMNKVRKTIIFNAALVFALFHIVMILAGYYLGHCLGVIVQHMETYHFDCQVGAAEDWAGVLGAVVLITLGLHMIKENLFGKGINAGASCPLQGWGLVGLAISVSLDALAAGFSLGIMDVDMLKLSIILGVIIFIMAIVGLAIGRRLGKLIGDRAELMGGLALVLLGGHVFWMAVYL